MGVVVDGSGTVNLGGVNTIRGAAVSGKNSGLNVGNTTAKNAVNIANGGSFTTIAANFRSLSIGNSTFGSNTVYFHSRHKRQPCLLPLRQ